MEESISTSSQIGQPKFTSRIEKIWLIVSCAAILGGAVLFFYGGQATGVGVAGVVNKLLGGFGMAIFGVGVLIVGLCFVKWAVVSVKALKPHDRVATLRVFGKQLLVVFLNILVYGGCFVVCFGALVALDGIGMGGFVAVVGIWAICVAVFIAYRRYRKKHKVAYDLVKQGAVVAFLLLFATFAIIMFARSEAPCAVQDLIEGPKTADVLLVEADIQHPSSRYRALVQDQHILTFCTAEEERIVLMVPENDVAAAQVINDYGNFVHLTYYPQSQVFCEAAPWQEGAEVMGAELLNKLVRDYAFDL